MELNRLHADAMRLSSDGFLWAMGSCNCHGAALDCHGVPWHYHKSAMGCHGMSWDAMDCHGTAIASRGFHEMGLTWTAMGLP